jgi:glycosyltransferase involved in cell wall biosynthesis
MKKTIIVLESRDFHGHIGRREQLFKLLSENYNIIVFGRMLSFIYHYKSFKVSFWSLFKFKQNRVNENLLYISLPQIFFPFNNIFRSLNQLNGIIMNYFIWKSLKKLDIVNVNYWWIAYPYAVDSLFGKTPVIYDCFDNHIGWKGFYSKKVVKKIEKDLLKKADITFFSSFDLQESKKQLSKSYKLIRNAADYEHFYISPKESLLKSNIVLYLGVISDWANITLIESIVELEPSKEFWFVGPVRKNYLSNIESKSNVKIFGEQPYSTLASFVEKAACCIIPFDHLNPLIKSTNPIKLYEYLAAGKPVVSTAMEEVAQYKEDVYIANSPEDFVHMINLSITENSLKKIVSRQQLAFENSWDERVNSIIKKINSL